MCSRYPLRATLISPTLGGASGVGRFTHELGSQLQRLDVEVKVISTDNTPYVPVKNLKNPSWAFLAQFKRKGKPDVIHAMNPISYVAAWYSSIPRVLTLHGVYGAQVGLLHGEALGAFSRRLERAALRWADVVVAVSKSAQEYYTKEGYDVAYIPNAVNVEELPIGVESLHPRQAIFVGRLSREKGVHNILTIAQQVEALRFIVVGDGPERATLERTADSRRVTFLGVQPWERTIRLIRGSEILIMPSLEEGLPTVLLEAMAVGTPVVASRVGGIPEAVDDGKTGLLFPPGDQPAMKEAITRLSDDEKLRRRLGDAARKRVAEEFSWKRTASKYLDLYRRLAKQRSRVA